MCSFGSHLPVRTTFSASHGYGCECARLRARNGSRRAFFVCICYADLDRYQDRLLIAPSAYMIRTIVQRPVPRPSTPIPPSMAWSSSTAETNELPYSVSHYETHLMDSEFREESFGFFIRDTRMHNNVVPLLPVYRGGDSVFISKLQSYKIDVNNRSIPIRPASYNQ